MLWQHWLSRQFGILTFCVLTFRHHGAAKDRIPKETPQERSRSTRMMATREELFGGNKETRQDIDPKETPQDKEPKHKDDGHKEESRKGNKETRQDKDPKDKEDGHKAK